MACTSGTIVATQFGEGNYQQMEDAIARLVGDSLPEAKAGDPDLSTVSSPEMYFGTEKNGGAIVASQSSRAGERFYTARDDVPLNRFAFSGTWKLSATTPLCLQMAVKYYSDFVRPRSTWWRVAHHRKHYRSRLMERHSRR